MQAVQYHDSLSPVQTGVKFSLQPLILLAVIAFFLMNTEHPMLFIGVLLMVHLLLGSLEYLMPARRDWLQSPKEKARNVAIAASTTIGSGVIAAYYAEVLMVPLQQIRENIGLNLWPHDWPLAVQLFMVFFASEFIWYWMHRAEHRFAFFWRVSGHGAHHSFKRLGAINFGANHPLELFLLVLPAAVIELVFGVGIAAAGAAVLTTTQASFAHANLNLNTKWIGLLFTTNEYHFHHHSIVLEESNTNYGCAAIIWDRLFGTFKAGKTLETGTGATEPDLWQKLIMPIKQPEDTATAPGA